MQKTIHLIFGAPLSGKTCKAKELAKQLTIPWISTDDIRTYMQKLLPVIGNYELFYSEEDTELFFSKYNTPESIFKGELTQCIAVQTGITHFIESIREWDDFIIEGHALTPKYIQYLEQHYKQYKFRKYYCKLPDKITLETRLTKRGLWDTPDKYDIAKYKQLELDWVTLFDSYIQEELKSI